METLESIYNRISATHWMDKNSIHSYIPVYDEILSPYRATAVNVLEIGLFAGGSMLMFEQYFQKAKIWGIDCDEQPHGGMADLRPLIAEGAHNIHIFDAANSDEVEKRFKGIKFDVIFEDANHSFEQQMQLYSIWKNYLSVGGLYIIEDIQNIDKHHIDFLQMDSSKEIKVVDRRKVKGRYDDVLVVIK